MGGTLTLISVDPARLVICAKLATRAEVPWLSNYVEPLEEESNQGDESHRNSAVLDF